MSLILFMLIAEFVSGAELTVIVTDPHSAVVAGAQLNLYRAGSAQAIASQSTSGAGRAVFAQIQPGKYSLEVLAPGFSRQALTLESPGISSLTVKLSIATLGDVVVVSATRTAIPLEESGSAVSVFNADQIKNKQPTSAGDLLRFASGAVIADAGRRGGLTSLFVRGGESRYNKVIVDGVPINDAGGTFDFGIVPVNKVDRLEFLRGAESTLYGSDAMTSVVQLWTATGHTRLPEFSFGADGGNFSTAHGYAALAGTYQRLDYNLFGDQFNTEGQRVNDAYSNALQGANIGLLLSPSATFRFRARHSNSRSGVPGAWNFNGDNTLTPLAQSLTGMQFLLPDTDQSTRSNNFLSSADLNLAPSPRWQHRLSGFEYNTRRLNRDHVMDRDCFNFGLDCPFLNQNSFNRAGFEYQGNFSPRNWAHTTFGYEFEDENGFLRENFTGNPSDPGGFIHPQRRNHALFGQQFLGYKRISFIGGLRYVNNASFGEKVVPRATFTFLAFKGNELWSGTRLRFAYGSGIKEPRFEESFGFGFFGELPNPRLRAEQNRSLEAGFQQDFSAGRYSLSADYYNNLFSDQITFKSLSPLSGQFINLNRSLAHGSEVEFKASPLTAFSIIASYLYTSTRIERAPLCDPIFSPQNCAGAPLLRRPRHSGSLLISYTQARWGSSLGGTLLGRRPDSDFTFGAVAPQNHTPGYARFDLGGWYRINRHVTAYANAENIFNRHYEDVLGYPALAANVRAGFRFHIGGE